MIAPSGKFCMAIRAGGDFAAAGKKGRVDDADCHPLGDVVDGDRQDHLGGSGKAALRSLRLFGFLMKVRGDRVEKKEKRDAEPEADKRREE